MPKGKVVQTELAEREYKLLQKALRERGLTIKQGLREAIRHWVRTQITIEEDPLFRIKPVRTGVKTDSSRLNEALYGREGSF